MIVKNMFQSQLEVAIDIAFLIFHSVFDLVLAGIKAPFLQII